MPASSAKLFVVIRLSQLIIQRRKKRGGNKFEDPVVSGVTECSCLAVRSPLYFYGPVVAHSFLINVLEISRGGNS